ncbi:hypothetical protein VF12_15580, partial [Nostoc linckia z15]
CLEKGVQDFFVLSQNSLPARILIHLKLSLSYLNVYSNSPQIPSKATKTKEFGGKTGAEYVVLLQIRAKFNSVSNISFFLG